MANNGSTIVLEPDPTDPEDFAVSEAAIEAGLAERRLRGAQKAPTKQMVTLRLDPDILAHFKAGGRGWQSRLNAALRRSAGL